MSISDGHTHDDYFWRASTAANIIHPCLAWRNGGNLPASGMGASCAWRRCLHPNLLRVYCRGILGDIYCGFFTGRWVLLEFGNFEAPASADSRPWASGAPGAPELLQTELQQCSFARVELRFRCTCIVGLIYIVGLGYYFAIGKGRIIACRC